MSSRSDIPCDSSPGAGDPSDLGSGGELERNRAIARSYFESFATGDPEAIAAHVSPDFVNEHTAALGSGCEGREEYRARLPGFLRDMDGLVYDVEHTIADDHGVAVFYTMRARWQGQTPIEVRGAQLLSIADGVITRRVDYWDSKVFLDQLEAGTSDS